MTDTHWITDSEQIRALESPMRQNIMDRLEAIGPSSVSELAESLGVAADALYYHLRKLEKVGMLKTVGTRSAKRRPEAIYELAFRNWHMAYQPDDPENVESLSSLTAAMLRQAGRDFERGFACDHVQVQGDQRNLWSLRLESRLTTQELKQINHHLRAVVDILRHKPDQVHREQEKKGDMVALTWVIAPVAPKRET